MFTEVKVDTEGPQMDELGNLGYSSSFPDVWAANMRILPQLVIALNTKTHTRESFKFTKWQGISNLPVFVFDQKPEMQKTAASFPGI